MSCVMMGERGNLNTLWKTEFQNFLLYGKTTFCTLRHSFKDSLCEEYTYLEDLILWVERKGAVHLPGYSGIHGASRG